MEVMMLARRRHPRGRWEGDWEEWLRRARRVPRWGGGVCACGLYVCMLHVWLCVRPLWCACGQEGVSRGLR